VDAFYEASMMLTTEGPVTDPKTSWQYVYASLYSVYGGVIFLAIIMTGVSPLLHRLMHNLWYAGGETPESDKVNEGTGKKAFLYEHRFQPPIKRSNLIIRALWHLLVAFAVLLLPIIFGMVGYNWFVGLNWVDAFYETIMVISTEGTTVDLDTTSGKVFVSLFSIYGYVFFLTAVGIVLSPFLHRLLHRFWHAAGESSEHKRAVDTSTSLPEQPHQPPIGRFRFAGRILWYFFVLYVVLAVSIIPGVLGYKYILGLDSLDSLYNTVMILTNEGPVVDAKTTLEKIFVAIYSMVTTVVFLVAIGMVLTPVLQRLLHTFWYAGGLSPKEQATGQERPC
jgi:hypothetical protein